MERLDLSLLDIADTARAADVSFTGAAAQSAALSPGGTGGVYDIVSDIDCFIKVAATADDVTTTTGNPLSANEMLPLWVPNGYKIGAVSTSASGTLKIHQSRRM